MLATRVLPVLGCGILLCSEISSPSLSGVYFCQMHDEHGCAKCEILSLLAFNTAVVI